MNDYWIGNRRAHLLASQVTAPWAARRGDGSHELMMVNRAFQIFFDARRLIRQCPDAQVRAEMTRDLESAARKGAGIGGPDDLEEAFEHLVANHGRWTDAATENYYGDTNSVYPSRLVSGPKSIVNFLDGVDDRMEELREGAENYLEQRGAIQQARRDRRWEVIGDALEEINDWGGRIKPFLWFAPSVESRVEGTLSITGVLSSIHQGLTDYVNFTGRGMTYDQALASIAFKRAIGMVPILGDFYVRAFEMIPNVRDWFVGQLRNYEDRIEQQVNRERYG